MMNQGRLTNWNDEKGYGFVEPNGGGQRAFVHVNAFQPRSRRPANGDIIVYEPVKERDGRYKATNIRCTVRGQKAKKKQARTPRGSTIVALFFMLFLFAAYLSEQLSLAILVAYICLSVITYIAYSLDKSAARNQQRRTKEATLHLLALVGGWPGALYARQSLRHKSSKTEFIRTFWGTVVVNVVAVLVLTSASARLWLFTLIG